MAAVPGGGFQGVQGAGRVLPPDLHHRGAAVPLVGNKIQTSQPSVKNNGTRVNTLWGEAPGELGQSAGSGKEGYALVADADRTSTNPGDACGAYLVMSIRRLG
jgi:hypothetical protein